MIHCSWVVLRSSFRSSQGTQQSPFCLTNSLGIAPKVPFARKMMTEISPFSKFSAPTIGFLAF